MRSLIGLVLLSLVAAACGALPLESANQSTTNAALTTTSAATLDASEQLRTARQLWTDAAIPTYRYSFEDECGECDPPGPKSVIVWEGLASSHTSQTVDRIFEVIDAALQDQRQVEVTYDPTLGYPIEIWIDREARAYDGGTHWLIHGFELGLRPDATVLSAMLQARRMWDASRPEAYEFEAEIVCDCSLGGTVISRVEGNRIVDWEVSFADGVGGQLSPITVDDMFDDLSDMLTSPNGYEDDGVHYRGFVQYDPDLGYPSWVGIEIDVLDPTSEFADLPPRLVTSITRLEPMGSNQTFGETLDLDDARDKWQASAIANYTYELTLHDVASASIGDFYLVQVTDGGVSAVSQAGQPVTDWHSAVQSFEGLFDLIEAHLASGNVAEVLYQEVFGYPVVIALRGPNDESSLVLWVANFKQTG